MVPPHILPEVGELKSGAGVVGPPLALFVAIAEKVEDEAAHRVGRVVAIVKQVLVGGMALSRLVHTIGGDELEKGFTGDLEGIHRLL